MSLTLLTLLKHLVGSHRDEVSRQIRQEVQRYSLPNISLAIDERSYLGPNRILKHRKLFILRFGYLLATVAPSISRLFGWLN